MAAVTAAAQSAVRASRRIYSERDVARALDRMAAKLTPRLERSNPVVLAVMHGGAFAALELCKRFAFPHEFDYVHVTRYRGETSARVAVIFASRSGSASMIARRRSRFSSCQKAGSSASA